MFKYFVAGNEVYKVSLKKRSTYNYDLQEQMLDGNEWTEPIRLGLKGKNMTLEGALKKIYGYPMYYDSLERAKMAIA